MRYLASSKNLCNIAILFFEFTHNCIPLKNMSLVWESAYRIWHFSVLYSGTLAFNFSLILYNHKSYLSKLAPLSLSTELIPYFLWFTGVDARSWYDFQFNLSRALSAFCLAKVSYSCVFENLSWKLYTLSNFLFNCLISSSIFSDWMQATFIDSSNLALSFLFSDFSQSDSSLFCMTFAHRLVFLTSRLKDWVGFLMKKFVSPFLFICWFIFLISSVSSCFCLSLPFGIVLSWAFGFIGV